jgi:hypothetical protein
MSSLSLQKPLALVLSSRLLFFACLSQNGFLVFSVTGDAVYQQQEFNVKLPHH